MRFRTARAGNLNRSGTTTLFVLAQMGCFSGTGLEKKKKLKQGLSPNVSKKNEEHFVWERTRMKGLGKVTNVFRHSSNWGKIGRKKKRETDAWGTVVGHKIHKNKQKTVSNRLRKEAIQPKRRRKPLRRNVISPKGEKP